MAEPGRLFEVEEKPSSRSGAAAYSMAEGDRVVRVLPDVSGLEREFDYVVPAKFVPQVKIGSLVRVELHGRRVHGWVTEFDPKTEKSVRLRSIVKVSSAGPPAEIIDLARWAAHRWAGRLSALLKTASPPRMVAASASERPVRLPASGPPLNQSGAASTVDDMSALFADAFAKPDSSIVRVAPAIDSRAAVEAAARQGNTLILFPEISRAAAASGYLKRRGFRVHLQPKSWAQASAGGVVIGTRSAVWAPTASLDAVLVVDEHDEAYQSERAPTWNARDVAIERANRSGVPCVLTSPAPSLAAIASVDRVMASSRTAERAGWPIVQVIDRRDDDPARPSLFSDQVTTELRQAKRAVLILNRKGRAHMLACSTCGELARTTDGERLMSEVDGELVAPATGERRPVVCVACAGTSMKRLRLGVTRAAEELAVLTGKKIVEVSSETTERRQRIEDRFVLGTEAALYAVNKTDLVVFLDFDQQLHAQRYRAAEQSMWLLARAARVAGRREKGGKVMVQTRAPDHRVLKAAVIAAPHQFSEAESKLRRTLAQPPFGAFAELSGSGAVEYAAAFAGDPSIAVLGPRHDGRFLIRCDDHETLADSIAARPRPKQRLRVAVDPPGI